MEKKRGRPAKIGVKRKKISVRVEGTDVEKLDFLVNEKCMTYTQIIKYFLSDNNSVFIFVRQ